MDNIGLCKALLTTSRSSEDRVEKSFGSLLAHPDGWLSPAGSVFERLLKHRPREPFRKIYEEDGYAYRHAVSPGDCCGRSTLAQVPVWTPRYN